MKTDKQPPIPVPLVPVGTLCSGGPLTETRWHGWTAYLTVIAFGLFLYGDLVFSRSNVVVSHIFTDICSGLLSWRQFCFGEMANGNLPLWDPYVFCGTPAAGNIQSAIFYPINVVLYLTLPIANAINADILLHVLLVGCSTMAWVRSRGTGWLPAVLSAAVVMAGAPVCLRLDLGQPNVIAVFAWLPLTLLVIDKLFERVSSEWILCGIGVVSMQLLAGHPQLVYCNALTAALYCGVRIVRHPRRVRTALALSALALAPLPIAAAALATGYDTMRESLRASGTSIEFSSSWSLPIENFLTAFVPFVYGDYTHVNYWGRWCLWDVCIFIGIASLFLLMYGAVYAPRRARIFAGTMLALLVLAALGRATPFFAVLYYCVPGISYFRAPSRFLLPALVFAALLAGLGADEFLKRPRRAVRFAMAAAVCGIGLLAAGLALRYSSSILDKPDGLWTVLVTAVQESDEDYWWYPMDDAAMEESVWLASTSALVGAGTCVVVAYLFSRAQRRPYRLALVCLGIVEILCFSRYARVTTDIDALSNDALTHLRAADPEDYRELQAKSNNYNWRRNFPASIGMKTAWGYDPVMIKRYAEFFAFALGGSEHQRHLTNDIILTNILDPISISLMEGIFRFEFGPPEAEGGYPLVKMPELLRLTRCKYVYFWPEPKDGILRGVEGIHEVHGPLPRFSIYRDYRVVAAGRVFLDMTADGADLGRTVYLEEEPVPRPDPGRTTPDISNDDRIDPIDESTDHVSVDVQLSAPGILFITDAYSDGWQATPLPGSTQRVYRVMPADYAFQAIPLDAGHHRIRIEYAPRMVMAGIWTSGVSAVCFVVACAVCAWRRFSMRWTH